MKNVKNVKSDVNKTRQSETSDFVPSSALMSHCLSVRPISHAPHDQL